MNRSTLLFLTLLAIVACLLGYNYFAKPFSTPIELITINGASPSPSTNTAMGSTFDSLSPRERVELVIAAPVMIAEDGALDDHATWVRANNPGVVTLFGDRISLISARAAIATILDEYEIPPLLAVDHEGGTVQRLSGEGFTVLPSWQSLCAQSSADRKALLSSSANELQDLGIDIVFAPVIDLTASSSALRNRTCGSEAEFVAPRAGEYIEVFTQHSILPVVKHFPGIGSVTRDLHQFPATITASEDELTVYQYLLPEYPAIGAMMGHVSVEGGLDGEICSLSEECVGGFKGLFPDTLIFSDALDMKSAAVDPTATTSAITRSLSDRAVRAVQAGNTILVFGPDVSGAQLSEVVDTLIQQYEKNSEFKEAIDASAQEIYQLRQQRH